MLLLRTVFRAGPGRRTPFASRSAYAAADPLTGAGVSSSNPEDDRLKTGTEPPANQRSASNIITSRIEKRLLQSGRGGDIMISSGRQ
jgi:hypothetical protein